MAKKKRFCDGRLIKKLDCWDLKLIKLTSATVILALVSGWSWFQKWVLSVQWYWFAIAAIIFAIRPLKRVCS